MENAARHLVGALLAVASSWSAPASASFDDDKKKAVAVDKLPAAVTAIIGTCEVEAEAQAECKENLAKEAKKTAGKSVYLNLGSGFEQFMSVTLGADGRPRLVWAPLVDLDNGLAFTIGKPQKLSDKGTVVLARRPLEGSVPEGIETSDLERAVQLGQVGVEVVGRFGAPWQLSARGKIVRGVAFEASALRFFHTRTGKTLFEGGPLK